MKKYKNFIWDWNGTLLNDVTLCVDIMNGLLSAQSLPLMTEDFYRKVFDFPVKNYYKVIGFDFEKVSFEDLSEQFVSTYTSRLGETVLQEGVLDVLTALSDGGGTHYVLSAAEQSLLELSVERFGLVDHFVETLGLADNYAASKVDNGKRLISDLILEDTVMIGDTVHDFEVAEAVGIDCVLVSHGHHSAERLGVCGVSVLDGLFGMV